MISLVQLAMLIAKVNATASGVASVLGEVNAMREAHAERDQLPEVQSVEELAVEFEAKRAELRAANRQWFVDLGLAPPAD